MLFEGRTNRWVFFALSMLFGGASLSACGDDGAVLTCPPGMAPAGGLCTKQDAGGGDGAADADAETDGGGRSDGPQAIDAGAEAATISTLTLEFGRAVVGSVVSMTVNISNKTPFPVRINTAELSGTLAAELTLSTSTPFDATGLQLLPGEGVDLDFSFDPTSAGVKSANMQLSLCDAGCPATLAISAEGILEAITCSPRDIDFRFVNPGACNRQTINCTNDSSYEATIVSADLTTNSSPAFRLSAAANMSVKLSAAEALSIDVDYCPTGLLRDDGTVAITVIHPDPGRATLAVSVTGQGGGPDLRCEPQAVDLGLVGVGQIVTRTVVCSNAGNLPLSVTAAMTAMGTPPELSLVAEVMGSPATFPVSLAANESIDLRLRYTPTAVAMLSASLIVDSSDRDTPRVTIPVTGQALDATGCTVSIAPAQLEFGVVSPGDTSRLGSRLENTGSGACAVSVLGFSAATPSNFTLVGGAASVSLNPGESYVLEVEFSPTVEAVVSGAVLLQTSDVLQPNPQIALSGEGLLPFGRLRVTPAQLDFGQRLAGCSDVALRILRFANHGTAATQVDLSLEPGTSTAFSIETSLISFSLAPGASVDLTFGFLPTAVGTFLGRLRVESGGATTFVGLSGSAALSPLNTDNFTGSPAAVLDVLLLVDDSCSMSEEQTLLAGAAAVLIARADASGTDYHVGVVTTDGTPGVSGTLRGTPRFVTSGSATRLAQLQANINVGVNGSGTEEGLRTASEAVTDPALLMGTNAGFLRPDGELVVLFLTDEEDSDGLCPLCGTVESFITPMANRPIGIPGSLRMYSITGGPTGCTGPSGSAGANIRITAAVAQTGGFDRSICSPSFNTILTEIADAMFSPGRSTFSLSARPAPQPIEVRVDGVLVPPTSGNTSVWGVDYARGRVSFAPGQAPAATADVAITYSSFCIPGTCGNGTPQPLEECDDGNLVNTDVCPETCYDAFCGDGYRRTGLEQCDDANTFVGDGCNSQCIIEGCGNGIPELPEECDDGMLNSNSVPNACRLDCRNFRCQDGVQDGNEACDDGNLSNSDACVGQCLAASCRDGFLRLWTEECDDGNTVTTDTCSNTCVWNVPAFAITRQPAVLTTTPGTPLVFTPNGDEGIATVPIGFAFDYLGTAATNAYVSSNGVISFLPTALIGFSNAPLPTVAAPNAIIAFWWEDLDASRILAPAAQLTTALSGVAPNRIRRFTFNNLATFSTGGTLLNVEVRLFETTNLVEVHYGALTEIGPAPSSYSAAVGWESADGLLGQDALGCNTTCAQAQWPTNSILRFTP